MQPKKSEGSSGPRSGRLLFWGVTTPSPVRSFRRLLHGS
ncbi:hypothetical protein SynPROSU1_01992 [Synechococcus sp. PROS-U-1]|nr:hypothetical protein SynPROSU1_01992 [Synechococcus sp. PROS-U-1]